MTVQKNKPTRILHVGVGAVKPLANAHAALGDKGPRATFEMNDRKHGILVDIKMLQPGIASGFHGGREYCESVLSALADRLPPGHITVCYDPRREIPVRARTIIHSRSIQMVAAKTSQELKENLDGVSFATHYVCQPSPDDAMCEGVAQKTICTLFGFRGIEMPTDSIEILYSHSVRRRLIVLAKLAMRQTYRNSLIARWRRFLSRNHFDGLITISRHTKYSLLSFAGDIVDAHSVVPLYPPPQIKAPCESVDFAAMGSGPTEYFLVLIGNRWIKNAARAVRALDQVYSLRPDITQKTIVLGCDKEGSFAIPVRNTKRFIFRPYVSHGQLQTFYANAFAFIYPTLNEGFGYPPLDAMRHGVPVLASAVSAVPEVCGVGASYFNPLSEHEITARVLEVTGSERLRTFLSEMGREQSALMERLQKRDLETLLSLLLK